MSPRDPEQTRQAILDVAYREFHERGFHETSLADILARTELTKGALYHHFGSKDALGLAVVRELIADKIREDWILPFRESDDPLACMKQVVTQGMASLEDAEVRQGCPLGNFSHELSTCHDEFRLAIQAIYEEWRQALSLSLHRGQAAGRVRGDVEPESVAALFVALFEGAAGLMKNSQDREPPMALMPALLDYLNSLKPRD